MLCGLTKGMSNEERRTGDWRIQTRGPFISPWAQSSGALHCVGRGAQVGCGVLVAAIFRNVTPCTLLETYHRFGGTYCIYLGIIPLT
jgi:hypothetical protein